MRRAFTQAVDGITSNADLTKIARSLEQGDIEGALRAVNLDARDFRPLGRTIESAYDTAGSRTAAAIQQAAPSSLSLIVRFDVRNPRAEAWLLNRSSTLVTRIVDDQRQMIRSALRGGMEAGKNPRTVALDLVGRLNRVTGRRQGGVVGLTARMEEASRGYAANLRSGDPTLMRRALGLQLRDRRFDRTVAKAIREGKPIPKKMVDKMVTQYHNRALKNRGDSIARTEMLEALSTANKESYHQAVEDGVIRADAVKRFPVTAGDERVRSDHRLIPGMNAAGVGLNEPFETPEGPMLNTPFGIQCRCWVETQVDFLTGVS